MVTATFASRPDAGERLESAGSVAAAALLADLASHARRASQWRGLTAGEVAEGIADRLAPAGAEATGPAQQFLEAVVAPLASARHRIQVDCDPALRLPLRELALLGVIAAEAVRNAVAHGFPSLPEGRVWVRLAEEGERIRLTVRDNGIGLPDLPPGPLSGRGLLARLAEHLGGYASLHSAPFGGGMVSVLYRRRPTRSASLGDRLRAGT